jgi:hypothetical protein
MAVTHATHHHYSRRDQQSFNSHNDPFSIHFDLGGVRIFTAKKHSNRLPD